MGVDVFVEHLFLLAAKKKKTRRAVVVAVATVAAKKTSQPLFRVSSVRCGLYRRRELLFYSVVSRCRTPSGHMWARPIRHVFIFLSFMFLIKKLLDQTGNF
jgi:hypothetical protein